MKQTNGKTPRALFALLLSLAALPMVGCGDGAAEEVGEEIDEAVEDVSEAIK